MELEIGVTLLHKKQVINHDIFMEQEGDVGDHIRRKIPESGKVIERAEIGVNRTVLGLNKNFVGGMVTVRGNTTVVNDKNIQIVTMGPPPAIVVFRTDKHRIKIDAK